MKKKLFAVVAVMFSLLVITQYVALAADRYAVDTAGYLNSGQVSEMDSRLQALSKKTGIDITLYIEDYMQYDEAEQAAKSISESATYGWNENNNGIMLYISREPRKYYLLTYGEGGKMLNYRGVGYAEDQFVPYLKDNAYYSAVLAYAGTMEEMAEMYLDGHPYNKHTGMETFIAIAAATVLPFVIAGLWTHSKTKKMDTAVMQDRADSYMKSGSFHVNMSKDIFLYSIVNRTEKPKSNSSSDSGRSYGGHGGSY